MPSRRSGSKKSSNDAIALLKADHDKVKKMFKEFERLHEDDSTDQAEQLAKQICNELTVHTTLEEIFYPEVREAIEDDDMLDEAEVEHASAKDLISQLESMSAADEKYAAKVTVLGEYVNHHIKEEQNEMFPKAKKAKLDMAEMGERMLARKQELMAQMGMESEGEEEEGESEERSGQSRSSHASR